MGKTFDSAFPAAHLGQEQPDADGDDPFYYDETDSSPSPGPKDYYRTAGLTFGIPAGFKADQARPVSPQTLQAYSSGGATVRDFAQRSIVGVGVGGVQKQAQQNQLYSKAQITSRFANQKQKRQMATQQAHPGLLNRTFNQTSQLSRDFADGSSLAALGSTDRQTGPLNESVLSYIRGVPHFPYASKRSSTLDFARQSMMKEAAKARAAELRAGRAGLTSLTLSQPGELMG